ncbi:MAG TPA: putative sulfate exporter family transporter [Phycisphaerae bacterium]|jgi:uncharacterized membrane protein YadS|nr:putative sulfate exporter family transporter [Phycisphaerae bacterium]HOB75023.1 putative sulfate exporter family transporter [Phycisphaerae bacterium]HOJ54842.1 putative sulfate exporter family transporter [Phycisphaerae bacterium]HOL26880.1 putative sulfate exporter family transporter [Phycisphaerae bacterium]HPP20835.1 putative sulfate exporter family transporter [Phycisphaerae bacterium]
MAEQTRKLNEDWLAVWIGLAIVGLSFLHFAGVETYGWAAKTSVWTSIEQIIAPVSKAYAGLPAMVSLLLTYLFLLVVMTVGAWLLGAPLRRFVISFTVIFAIAYACWALGHYAYIAATRDKLDALNIGWSLNLTGEAGYILALLAGLAVANFFPRLTLALQPALRPEWYVKTAIVILGAGVGVKSAANLLLARDVVFRGLCAIIEAYLIYWPIVYFISRRYFRFSREWAAPLASGISICGVSAAIATGAAIRTRPIVPIMVSSLVVIFAVVELLLLPFVAQQFLYHEPMVAGAWMGLAVKTDGAAVASGAVTDALIRAKALGAAGVQYAPDWIANTTTTVKMFIDVFIGIWAFILALVWTSAIERRPGERVRVAEIWHRFPKFVLGYAVAFGLLLWVATRSDAARAVAKSMTSGTDVFRQLFFVLTFFAIGTASNFRKLREEGMGKLLAVYLLCLFGFIIWVGLVVSFIFFHGVKPPTV